LLLMGKYMKRGKVEGDRRYRDEKRILDKTQGRWEGSSLRGGDSFQIRYWGNSSRRTYKVLDDGGRGVSRGNGVENRKVGCAVLNRA